MSHCKIKTIANEWILYIQSHAKYSIQTTAFTCGAPWFLFGKVIMSAKSNAGVTHMPSNWEKIKKTVKRELSDAATTTKKYSKIGKVTL